MAKRSEFESTRETYRPRSASSPKRTENQLIRAGQRTMDQLSFLRSCANDAQTSPETRRKARIAARAYARDIATPKMREIVGEYKAQGFVHSRDYLLEMYLFSKKVARSGNKLGKHGTRRKRTKAGIPLAILRTRRAR